jgi:hypothetical protein
VALTSRKVRSREARHNPPIYQGYMTQLYWCG